MKSLISLVNRMICNIIIYGLSLVIISGSVHNTLCDGEDKEVVTDSKNDQVSYILMLYNGNQDRKVAKEIKQVKGVDRYGKPYLLIQVDLYPGSGLDVEERTRVLNFETGKFIDNDIYIAIEDDDIVKATPKKGFFIARRGSGGTFGAMGAIIQEYIFDSSGKEGMMTETKYWLMDNFSFSETVADFFDISNPSMFGIVATVFIIGIIIRFGIRISKGSKVTKSAK